MKQKKNSPMNSPSYDKFHSKYDLQWHDIASMEDFEITYLLYQEGKNVNQIAKIRNLKESEIKKHLLLSKKYNNEKKIEVQKKESPLNEINYFLSLSKEEREVFLISLSDEEAKLRFQFNIITQSDKLTNIHDIIVMLWTVGELQIKPLYGQLKYFSRHPHGNMRRICYSSMGKTGEMEFIPYIMQGLKDRKPQVRQYAVLAMGKVGKREEQVLLKKFYDNEKVPYVLRAVEKAIANINQRYEDDKSLNESLTVAASDDD